MAERVGNTGVFRLGTIGIVHLQGFRIVDHVFQQRPKADGVIDVRLGLLVQVDHFGITAAFKIEYAVLGPAMLVITDQRPAGVGGQGGFASA